MKAIPLKLALTCAIFLSTIAFSQPVIKNAENFSIGTRLTFRNCLSKGIFAGDSGANKTWDFTGVKPSDTSIEWMVSPLSTPKGKDFPTADFVEKYSAGFFVYVHRTSGNNYLVGYADTTNNSEIKYSNSQEFAHNPITFRNKITDTFALSFTSLSYNYRGTGTTTINADGYGTLKLPNGTFNNVLRIKITQEQHDSTNRQISAETTYTWFDTLHASALLKIDSGFQGKTVEYLEQEKVPSGISREQEFQGASVSLYPDPFSQSCVLTYSLPHNELVSIILSEPTGRQIAVLAESRQIEGKHKLRLDASPYHLPTGMYLLTIRAGNEVKVLKIIKTE